MSSSVAKAAGKAIYAAPQFLPKGSLTQPRFNLLREIAIGMTLGIGAGLVWKVRRGRAQGGLAEQANRREVEAISSSSPSSGLQQSEHLGSATTQLAEELSAHSRTAAVVLSRLRRAAPCRNRRRCCGARRDERRAEGCARCCCFCCCCGVPFMPHSATEEGLLPLLCHDQQHAGR